MHLVSARALAGLVVVATTLLACDSGSSASNDDGSLPSGGKAATAGQGQSAGSGGAAASAQGGASSAGASAGQSSQGGASAGQSGASSQGGAGQPGQGGQGGSGGSAQAGSGGSAQAGSGGSAQAGQGGSAQAGSGGSDQAGSAGSGQGGSDQGGAAGEDGGLPPCPCFVKVAWCGSGVAKQAESMGCSVPLAENEGDILYCPDGQWAVKEECEYGCNEAPTGTPDSCKPKPLPECPCFVESSWCGTGAAKKADSMGCTIPLLPTHASDLLYCPGGKWSVKEDCPYGCTEAPTGVPDACKSDPTAACVLLDPPHKAQLKWGLHPDASDALAAIGVTAAGISQTIGSAAASAGTHAQDGTYNGFAYSAATDLRISGKTEAQIHTFLDNLAKAGFVAWYRKPGYDGWPSSEVAHVHAIWVGAKMKLSLRNQVRDFMAGKNGLASHTTYKFHTWSQCWRDALWKRYLKYNPASN